MRFSVGAPDNQPPLLRRRCSINRERLALAAGCWSYD